MKWRPCLFVLLATPSVVEAASTFQRVSGSPANVGGFEFRVTATPPADDGSVAFLVQVVARQAQFSRSPATGLAVVHVSEEPPQAVDARTVRSLNMNRRDDTITLGFSVSEESLSDEHLSFLFTNFVEVELNGKIVPAASADFFYIRLNDFVHSDPEDADSGQ